MGSVDDVVEAARIFATDAHNNSKEKRKYSNQPYIIHPQQVVQTLTEFTADPSTLAAAWLHDVIEDTPVTESYLREIFGDEITNIVVELTPPLKSQYPDRAERKKIENESITQASDKAKLIKLSDIFNNTGDVREGDPEFAKIYLPEKLIQLELLKGVNDDLWEKVHAQITRELSLLNEK